mmetsp:Transcript_16150/g.24363  ORF Transcript_16150/g.24363 Transcript_16150/m.24363 type:complete len:449 (-) Transcript_16150:113-1459(-)
MSRIDWQGLGGFGQVFKGGVIPPDARNQAIQGHVFPPGHDPRGDTVLFEDFERKAVDPLASYHNFARKSRPKAMQVLKDAGQEATPTNINAKLQQLWQEMNEEQKKQFQVISNKRVRVQRQGAAVFGSEKFEARKLKQQSGAIIKSIDKLYSMGVAVTMAMAARNGKTYKYFPEEMANEREVMKSLDQHLLQLQYSLWDEKDLGPMTLRASNAKERRNSNNKVTCKKSLAEVIRPRLESILGGTISWKKLQTGATKLLGWPLKDKDTGKDRFPNRFFDLKISEMKSILNVIDGIHMIDHDREGRHVVGIVTQHINRIISTYSEKHKDNKELQTYTIRLKAALSVATAGDRLTMPHMSAQLSAQLPAQLSGQMPTQMPPQMPHAVGTVSAAPAPPPTPATTPLQPAPPQMATTQITPTQLPQIQAQLQMPQMQPPAPMPTPMQTQMPNV